MKIERKRSRMAEVYTSSLNDIMFFLLLFFLIVSTMVTPVAIKVTLPKSSTSEQVASKKNINLSVTADLKYYIDDREISFEEIEPTLAQLIKNFPDDNKPNILLQADQSLSLQNVVRVIDISNRLNIKMILFTGKQE